MWYYWLHKSHAIHVTFRLLAILHPIGGHFSLSCYGCNKAIALSICSLRLFSSFSLLFLQSPFFLQSRLFFHSPFFLQASLFQLPLCLCSADDSTPATMLEWEWLYRVKRCLLTVWYHTSIQFLIKSSSSFLLLASDLRLKNCSSSFSSSPSVGGRKQQYHLTDGKKLLASDRYSLSLLQKHWTIIIGVA